MRLKNVPSVKRRIVGSPCRRGRRDRGFDDVGGLSSPVSAIARPRARERMDARRFVGDERKRLAQEPFGVVAGETEPPRRFFERRARPGRADRRGRSARAMSTTSSRCSARLLGVAGRQLGGGDAHEQFALGGPARPRAASAFVKHLGRVLERERAHRDLGGTFGDVDRGGGIGDRAPRPRSGARDPTSDRSSTTRRSMALATSRCIVARLRGRESVVDRAPDERVGEPETTEAERLDGRARDRGFEPFERDGGIDAGGLGEEVDAERRAR